MENQDILQYQKLSYKFYIYLLKLKKNIQKSFIIIADFSQSYMRFFKSRSLKIKLFNKS